MVSNTTHGSTVALVLGCALFAAAARAQCALQWQPNAGPAAHPAVLRTLPNGDVLAAGDFTQIEGIAANRIARHDGLTWHPLGGGLDGPVRCAAGLQNGDVVASGAFTLGGAIPVGSIARWDGAAWSAFAPVPPSSIAIEAIEVLPTGDVVAAGSWSTGPFTGGTHVELWDGTAWRVIGTAYGTSSHRPLPGLVALAITAAGELLALGDWAGLQPAGNLGARNELVRWDGTSWHHLGERPDPVALLTTQDGAVCMAWGHGVRRFDGTAWIDAGAFADVRVLAELPDGDLLAGGGTFVDPFQPPPIGLRRFDGTAWTEVAPGTTGAITALAAHASGQLVVGGELRTAAGPTTTFRAIAPCPAVLGGTFTRCIGPAGPLRAAGSGRPWTGTTFRATATGFVPNALGALVTGWSTAQLPLAAVHPSGLAGCDLLATPDALRLVVPAAGVASGTLSIPDVPALVGTALHQQFLQAALGPNGALVSLSSSDLLSLVVGVF